jgi:hypothetical protein
MFQKEHRKCIKLTVYGTALGYFVHLKEPGVYLQVIHPHAGKF